MRCRSNGSIHALFGVIALILACSDSTAPVAARLPGRYELATVLETYTSFNDCTPTNNGPRCSPSTVAAGASKLHGTFTVGDTIPGYHNVLRFPVSDIVLQEADCALSTTQCTETTRKWISGVFEVKRDSLILDGMLSGGVQIYLRGQFTEDRFTGEVTWYTYIFCCGSSSYSGTFVATRQR